MSKSVEVYPNLVRSTPGSVVLRLRLVGRLGHSLRSGYFVIYIILPIMIFGDSVSQK